MILPRWLSGKESACQCRRQETQVQVLGQEDPLEDEVATQYFCLGNPMDRGAWRAAVHGVAESWTWQSNG